MLPLYIVSTTLLILAPGANMMMILALASANGGAAARRAALGLTSGVLCHTALAATGGALVLQRWPAALHVIQMGGGVVLLWIGGQMVIRQLWPYIQSTTGAAEGPRSAYIQGVLSSLTNVKTLVLFISFLPQFFTVGQPLAGQFVFHGGIYALLTLAIYASIGSLAGYFGETLRRPTLQRWLRGSAGCVIVGFGVLGFIS
jgi:threonine/homoserine/homoserine lactone efflux protein